VYKAARAVVKRQSLTIRMQMRRLTQLTNAFSKNGQPVVRLLPALRSLQLLPDSSFDSRHSCNGIAPHGSRVRTRRTAGLSCCPLSALAATLGSMIHILAGNAAGDVDSILEAAKSGKSLPWIVPKKAHATDRALFHLPGRGFAARGVIGSEPRPLRNRQGRYSAVVREIKLLSSAVPLAFVRKNHPAWEWPTYPRSYATIDGALETRLEEVLDGYQGSFAEPLTEGRARSVSVTMYERNPLARQQCIAHYGTNCYACGFSFGETYGETAEGYIHVHHLKNISGRGGEHAVDPVKDLRPICPNCHTVVHLQTPPLSIIELKRMLKRDIVPFLPSAARCLRAPAITRWTACT
jgi:hypothetical protein